MAKNPFKLRSGNTPLFKSMGSSPYHKDDDDDTNTKKKDDKNDYKYTKNTTVEGSNVSPGAQTAISALTSGLDAVYGTGKVKFSNPVTIAKEEEEEKNTIAQNIISNETKTGQMPDEDWKAGQAKAKESNEDLDALVAKRETLTKDSTEWKENQNKINEALGNKKRYKID